VSSALTGRTVARIWHRATGQAGTPSPDAPLPRLDDDQLHALRRLGQEWQRVSGDPEAWRRALPVDPNVGSYPDPGQLRPLHFVRFVPVAARGRRVPAVEATDEAESAALDAGQGRLRTSPPAGRPSAREHRDRS